MSVLITVLYEDQCAAKPSNYGPHILVLACVADTLGGDLWALRARVTGQPKKGDTKLRAALRDRMPSFARLVRVVTGYLTVDDILSR